MSMSTVPAEAVLRKPVARRNVSSDAILSVARKIIDEQGLSGAQARPIAEAAGCSVGTLYNIFDSLDTLILRVNAQTLSEFQEEARSALDQSVRDGAAPIERLVALADAYVDFAENHTMRWSAVFEFRRPPEDQVPKWYSEQIDGMFALVEESLSGLAGIRDETMRVEIARALWASVHGIVSLAFARRIGPIVPDNVRRHVEIIVRAAWAGFSGKPA